MGKCLLVILLFLNAAGIHAQNKRIYSVSSSITELTNLDSLEQSLATKKNDTSKAILLGKLCFLYAFNQPEKGLAHGQKGIQLSQMLGYQWGLAYSTQSLSMVLWSLGDYDNSLQHGLNALHLFEELKDQERIGFTYLILSNIYRETGDYKRALTNAQKGRSIYESLNLSLKIPDAIIGSIYELQNKLDSATYYVHKAIEQDKTESGGKWGWLYYLMGNIYLKKKSYNTALAYYRAALPLVTKKDIVETNNSLATLYKEVGQLDSSIYYASEILQKWSSVSYQKGILKATNTLAEVYKRKNQRDSTIKYLELSVALNNKLFNQEQERDIQSLSFKEQFRQDEIARERQRFRNQLKLYGLLMFGIMALGVALLLWRNDQHRKKAFTQLQGQKAKTEQALEELKSTQAQLVQREKMASLGELTSGIAHEIQNPLNFVNNFSDVNTELIEEMKQELRAGNNEKGIAIANEVAENQQKITHHSKRADGIVKGMLQHSRSSTSQKEPTDINKLADEYLRLCYHGLRAKDKDFSATLKTDFDESIETVNIIPQDIGRVLLNLYTNAFYVVNEKKKLNIEEYEPIVSIQTKSVYDKIEIKVSDNGNGIPQKVLDKIFQPFFTTKPTGQGTGLGLSLSYDIIKAHGGELKVETKEGEGSQFTIQL